MQVGVEWNAGRNAGLLPAGRTVHYRVTNSSLQRVGDFEILSLSLSFFTLSFYIRAFCTCSWNDDNGTGQTKVSLFYRGIWLRMSHSATLMIKPIRRLFVNREDRLIRWSEMTLEFDWFDRFLHCWIFASSKFFDEGHAPVFNGIIYTFV